MIETQIPTTLTLLFDHQQTSSSSSLRFQRCGMCVIVIAIQISDPIFGSRLKSNWFGGSTERGGIKSDMEGDVGLDLWSFHPSPSDSVIPSHILIKHGSLKLSSDHRRLLQFRSEPTTWILNWLTTNHQEQRSTIWSHSHLLVWNFPVLYSSWALFSNVVRGHSS